MTTADQVDVVLSAEVDGYIRDLKRADSEFSRIMRQMEAQAEAAGREIGKALGGAGGSSPVLSGVADQMRTMARAFQSEAILSGAAIERIGGSAHKASTSVTAMFASARTLAKEAQNAAILAGRELTAVGNSASVAGAKITTSFNGASAAAHNAGAGFSGIGAQFQDIGVTAAMGMNPMLIALQQGTQLASQLQVAMAGGKSAASTLGAAFLSVVNPISLVTIGLIAVGVAAAQYFGEILNSGKLSEEELKKQEDAVRRVADRWGDAVPALKAYVDELDRAAEASDEVSAADAFNTAAFADANALMGDFVVSMAEVISQLQEAGGASAEVSELQSAVLALASATRDGSADASDLERVTAALAAVTSGQGSPAVADFANQFGVLGPLIMAAAAAMAEFNSQTGAVATGGAAIADAAAYVAQQKTINSLTAEELSLTNEINRQREQAKREGVYDALGEERIVELAKERLSAEERRRQILDSEKAGSKAASSAASDAERELKAVLDLIEALEYEQSVLGLSNEQKAVSNALRDAGAAATDEQRARIEELVLANMAEEQSIQRIEDAMRTMENMASTALTGFLNDLRAGKDGAEALSNMFNKIADQLIQMAVNGLVQAAFGGLFGGGGFGNIFGGLFGGARANGGPVSPGKSYLVGERGPELFSPSSAGNITPNGQLGGGYSEVVVVVEASEYFDGRVARVSGPVAARTVAAGIGQYDANLSSRMVEQNARNG